MTSKINKIIDEELVKFSAATQNGATAEAAIKTMLRRLLKEQEKITRTACAEAVLKSNNEHEAHELCLDVDTLR